MTSAANTQRTGMRLGTRSCLECRRRKVRCVFDGNDKSCKQCKLHDTVCKAQRSSGVSADDKRNVTQNLSRSHQISDDAFQLFLRTLDTTSRMPVVTRSNEAASDPAVHDENIVLEESGAPLIEFLHKALPVAPTSSFASKANVILPSFPGTKTTLPPLPNIAALVKILQCTEAFWIVWPLAAAASTDKLSGFPESVVDAITFVYNSLHSENPGDVAKCLVWLTLCILQLPKDFAETSATQLPLPKSKIVELYLRCAATLINEFLESGSDSLSGIEALAVQYKCYIDLARPQQAWKCARRAIDHALILRLDRIKGETPKDRYRQLLWATIWGGDRKMALFLGLPYTVPEHLLAAQEEIHSMTDESRIMHKLNLISGHIIDRDRGVNPPYSVTSRIAEEMDDLKAEIPHAWWDLNTTDSDSPLADVFRRRATVFIFHITNQLLHLPYMLQARYDDKYRYSRTTILSSTEVMLNTWRQFPCHHNIPVACDYLDFCAFNAAVILAADLVSCGSQRSPDEEKRQWELVMSTAELMQWKADMLGSTVPAQSAQVLRTLYAARHGTYSAAELYEVVIPYFGKISIKQLPGPESQIDTDCFTAVDTTFGIDFDTTAFNFRLPTELDPTLELGADWSQFSQMWASDSLCDQYDFSQQ